MTVISKREFSLFELVVSPSLDPKTNLTEFSVAWSEDQMTEVRWFLSIQFSKSLVPWRAYQSRALGALCQALFGALTGARLPLPYDMGSATIRKR
jgi:hypothetical protein